MPTYASHNNHFRIINGLAQRTYVVPSLPDVVEVFVLSRFVCIAKYKHMSLVCLSRQLTVSQPSGHDQPSPR